ncbi:MAG TPA: phospholipase D-like domain-containing protein [Candidatus Saccharimonadales bacterium]
MFSLRRHSNFDNMFSSRLFDQNSFYQAFIDDLKKAKNEVIIESPFITAKRMAIVLPLLRKLTKRGVRIVVNTKPLDEHEFDYRIQTKQAIDDLQELGILVLFTNGHHRKLAIIDKSITWEGSLNILSQNDSCEVMRRMYSEQLANQMLSFLHLEKFIA